MSFDRTLFGERSRFCWLIGPLIGICFWDVLAGGRSLYFRDFSHFGYPLAAYLHDRFWAGELPLWNPFNNGGLPFLAQWNTMALYPGSLFYELLPLPWSVNVFCVAHLALGGFGMRRLIWKWTGSRIGADVAGLLFAFNGLALNCLMWPNNAAAWGWMPWLVAELAGRNLARAALAGAMQLLTGAPEVILFTWLTGAVIAGWRNFLFIGGAGLLAAAFAAPQLLPFFELYQQSHRTGGDFATGDWALSLRDLCHLMAPLFNGAPTAHGVYLQEGQKWTSSFYAGNLTLALALTNFKRPGSRKLFMLAAASLALACGVFQFGLFRYPVKWVIPAVFCLTVLGGLGVASVFENRKAFLALRLPAAVLTMALFLILFLSSGDKPSGGNVMVRMLFLWLGVWCLNHGVRWGLLAVLALDLVTHMPWQNPTIDADHFKPAARADPGSRSFLTLEAYTELRSRMLPDAAQDFQVRRGALLQNLNLIDQGPKLDGFFSLYPMREREFRQALYLAELKEVQPALDFLGVHRHSRPGSAWNWDARGSALPLVTAGQEPVYAREGQILRAVLAADFQPLETVYLHDRVAETNRPSARRTASVARIAAWTPHRATIDLSNHTASAMIVVAQSFDPNWVARADDGSELKKWRVNYNFLGIEAPPGIRTVELRYVSTAFEKGLAVALAAGLLLLILKRVRPGV